MKRSPVWIVLEWTFATFVALLTAALLFACLPDTEEIVDKCEKAANKASAEATAECQALVEQQIAAGRAWLHNLAESLGCVQVIDPVDGPTSEWDCSAVCEKAPDSVLIP